MGAPRRARAWTWELSWSPGRFRKFAATSPDRFLREPVLRPDLLVKSTSAERARNRYRKGARPEMATRPVDKHLHLSRCAERHDRRAWLQSATFVRHSILERGHRASGPRFQILRCAFPSIDPGPVEHLTSRPIS